MKKKLILMAFAVNAFILNVAGQDAPKCKENFQSFKEKTLSGAYDDALVLLTGLREKCASFNDTIYSYGEVVLKFKAEASRTPEEKQGFIDSLLALYNEQEVNFPGSGSEIRRAMLMKEYRLAKDDEVYKILDTSFAKNRKAFTAHAALQTYFMMFLEKYESDKSGISESDFMAKYGDIMSQVAFSKNEVTKRQKELLEKKDSELLNDEEKQFIAGSTLELEALSATGDNINILASKYFSCSKLEPYFSEQFEKNKNNAAWLQGMVSVLYSNRCYKSDIMYEGARQLFKLQPDANLALMLGGISVKKKNTQEGIAYYNKAAELEVSPERKAAVYMDIAKVMRNTDKGEAKNYLLKAVAQNPKQGDAYLSLAEMYANAWVNECKFSDFEKKALNWLAIETVKKAETADPKYKGSVAAMVQNFEKNVPTKDETKKAGFRKKDKVTFGCWVNESITIPNL